MESQGWYESRHVKLICESVLYSTTVLWVCSCCTFLNAVRVWTGAKCQMCETAKRTLSASATNRNQQSLQSPKHNSSESPEIVEVDCQIAFGRVP
jgi:hypothetical protein